jgi:predicted TIM-barrel fold metal-dependent hydrolase
MGSGIIDADGHVYEDASLADFVAEPFRSRSGLLNFGVTGTHRLFPTPDGHHFGIGYRSPKAFGGGGKVGPKEWLAFLEAAGLDYSVLYPTAGLSMGLVSNPDWAAALARAYNDWLHERFLKLDPRLKGMALLPLQDPSAAAEELRRSVTEKGMLGGLLPSRGLPKHLGAEEYWPVYAEAERLDCALAVHGGSHSGLGFDGFSVYPPIGGLGHPFSLMIALSGLVFHGALDRFPRLRVGFLEGGAGWASFWMDRMDRSSRYHFVIDPRGRYQGPTPEKPPSSYLKSGRLFIGCEGNEESLAYQVGRVGHQAFLFASDFPHEIGPEDCRREARDIAESKALSAEAKAAILQGKARRFYGL